MRKNNSKNLEEFDRIVTCRQSLVHAINRGRSPQWCLRLWSRFIKARDLYRCVCCDSNESIQAHHIIRKCLYPWAAFEMGNGISLCRVCHRRVHEKFNGRPDLTLPLGAEQGDDQDEWAYLFGLLLEDAISRNLDQDEFYFLEDHVLKFFVKCQGYTKLYQFVINGEMSRIKFAHEIWRTMPEMFYANFISDLVKLNFTVPNPSNQENKCKQ